MVEALVNYGVISLQRNCRKRMYMNVSKKALLALPMLFVGLMSFAQMGVWGTVADTSGYGIPGVTVTIVDSLSGNVIMTTTDQNGFYSDTINTSATQALISASITDCNGVVRSVFAAYIPFLGAQMDFTYCANGFGSGGSGGGTTTGCSASFSWSFSGLGPNSLTFTPDTIDVFSIYTWNINGLPIYAINPTVNMVSSQPAYVCLTVTDTFANCSDTYCDTVVFSNIPCNSAFTVNPSPTNPMEYSFYPIATSAGLNYFCDFGDGDTSSFPYSSHTYSNPGQYNVCLTVSDTNGSCSTSTCNTVNVGGNTTCDASFGFANSPNLQSLFYFYPTTPNSSLIHWWDFGDGNTSPSATSYHTYGAPGTYTVSLTVIDPATGCTDTSFTNVTVDSTLFACSANFYPVNAGPNTVSFVPFSTTSLGTTYDWDFGDGNSSNQMYPTHTYQPTPGNHTFNVCLTLTTDTGCVDSMCMPVNLQMHPGCQAAFSAFADTSNYLNTSFTAHSINTGLSMGYSWDFGDGNAAVGQNVMHTYAQDGTYIVTLTALDSTTNCTSTFIDTLTVDSTNIMSAVINFTNLGWNTVQLSTQVALGGNKRSGNERSNLSFFWELGYGNMSTVPSPTHAFPHSGMHNVCVTVKNTTNGYSTTHCQDIEATFLNIAEAPKELNYVLYPIPASDRLIMEWNEVENAAYTVYNLQGQLVMNGIVDANSGKNNIDVSRLSSGVFLMHIRTSSRVQTQRFVIE